ncbi:glycosyltransferase [Flavobacterium sp. UBA6135]|uniref:glycosyltransferase n=1 Tax=Flavobacterium sp. UBA6135 TaxID=1946553 RepID=UPI0025BF94B0|nr:glycosyltransferase [Flavobacterium sp. UBA6135]
MKRKKLLIISHTEHYTDASVAICGWGPTVHEINYLAEYWEEVVHVACYHTQSPPPSSVAYAKSNIKYVPIPAYGGSSFIKKIGILQKMPGIIRTVKRQLAGATEVQLRTPTAMGLFLLPLFTWFWKRDYIFWVKYAGDWEQEKPPRSNGWQRWFLQQKWVDYPVTINGFWPHQAPQCFSFENPCLTEEHLSKGQEVAIAKQFTPPFVLTFVGRIDHVKGVNRILDAVATVPSHLIKALHIIGDGPNRKFCELQANELKLPIYFHGYLDRREVHDYLAQSHFFLLPSTNEGFPKVIAEAACYGAIPVVSNVSSIKHYLTDTNGYVWDTKGVVSFTEVLQKAVMANTNDLKEKSLKVQQLATLFTFANYYRKLRTLVFKESV